jgi:hypothetical protein
MSIRQPPPKDKLVCPICKKFIVENACEHYTSSGKWFIRYWGWNENALFWDWAYTTVIYWGEARGGRVLELNGYVFLDDEKIEKLLMLK